jgi:excisionase family DNA binding protein
MSIIADLSMPTERLLTSIEVATLFRVDPKTVARWARVGRLRTIPTPGGRLLRFPESAVREFLEEGVEVADQLVKAKAAEAVSV